MVNLKSLLIFEVLLVRKYLIVLGFFKDICIYFVLRNSL